MNFTQAREFVKANPKRIGSFVRVKLPAGAIKRSTVINFIRYDFDSFTGQSWRYGYSTGDGKVYGHKAIKSEHGLIIDQPDKTIICDEITTIGEYFEVDANQPDA